MAYDAGVNEFILGTELFQIREKLPPKEPRHHLDVDEEIILARLPFPSILGQSSAGDNIVDMGMVHQVLSPSVQDRDESDLRAKMLPGFRELGQGFRNRFKQDAVEGFLIPEDEGIQKIGDGEDDVEVRDGKQVFSPSLDPLLFL